MLVCLAEPILSPPGGKAAPFGWNQPLEGPAGTVGYEGVTSVASLVPSRSQEAAPSLAPVVERAHVMSPRLCAEVSLFWVQPFPGPPSPAARPIQFELEAAP